MRLSLELGPIVELIDLIGIATEQPMLACRGLDDREKRGLYDRYVSSLDDREKRRLYDIYVSSLEGRRVIK